MAKGKKSGSYILGIGTAVPVNRYKQQVIADFMVRYFKMNKETSRKLNVVYHKSGIDYRYSVLSDFNIEESNPQLFEAAKESPLLSERLQVYNRNALSLSLAAIDDCRKICAEKMKNNSTPIITHLITVSCTGMSAPGIDIQILKSLKLPDDIERTSINFMGCYASFHALKYADAVCRANNNAVVLIVAVEICSIHFQKETDAENLVVNSLFADGAAAVMVVGNKIKSKVDEKVMAIKSFHSEVIHEGEEMMSWNPNETGFIMGLDPRVPHLIEAKSSAMVGRALKKDGLKKSEVTQWALHPGGRKILYAAIESLNLTEKDLHHSFDVLRDFGNMSSPTILFVLKSIWNSKKKWKRSEKIFAAGFGPGLTIETALFQPA